MGEIRRLRSEQGSGTHGGQLIQLDAHRESRPEVTCGLCGLTGNLGDPCQRRAFIVTPTKLDVPGPLCFGCYQHLYRRRQRAARRLAAGETRPKAPEARVTPVAELRLSVAKAPAPEPPPLTRLLATCPECHTQRRCRPVRLWVRELPAAWEQGKRPKVRCEVCGRIWTPEPGECVLR